MARRVHIVGGGLSGLSAAVEIAGSGQHVIVHEAGPACGGRARSYEDKKLGCRIDNGNHLLLTANEAVFRYMGLIGALNTLQGPEQPIFPFVDLRKPCVWTLDLSMGRVPWWVFSPNRRVPGMKLGELLSLKRLIDAKPDQVVSDCLLPGEFSRRLLDPFSIAALNTPSDEASAALLGHVISESLAKGGRACLPRFPKVGLSESLVDPALSHLSILKAEVRTGRRVTGIETANGRVAALIFPDERIDVGEDDAVILAVTAPVAASLLKEALPDLVVPDEFEGIFNAHFRLERPPVPVGAFAKTRFVGVVGAVTEWIFLKDDILSVTVSAANRYADRDPEELGRQIWQEVRQAMDGLLAGPLPAEPPLQRLVWEKRATFAATPAQLRKRPGAATGLVNLALAGDWTATGLPATIDGSIRSGVAAVKALGLRGSISD
ncbi:hydroxysqualene dehydroxylase HpnE [Acetobacter sp.]|jgi:squalene-associated FAD-dependent desaturase|uniref:hydroxysqualene dehydroxylase HpnE n=1 Tax=Acetobacter sp. TaxID=440 RepID=UPI0025B87244|nr:hydroxysqualene dehydroxylase HpnE [Acetobacter sp.]MCH4091302.1 hydroxysqualene dehydroxylase HpnE [Acetobacter sp.]MCI1299280.1 hydroxysqualene dehydroxylase HpnE [Acetobacter sp.]MCI1316716.1 hydroxysqualene dehydroxylase HpnE [Acetobacter sp.]